MDAHYLTHRYYPKLLLGRALLGLPLLYPLVVFPLGPALLVSVVIVVLVHANDTLFKALIDRDIEDSRRAAEREAARQAAERSRRILAAHQAALAKAKADMDAKAAAAEAARASAPADAPESESDLP